MKNFSASRAIAIGSRWFVLALVTLTTQPLCAQTTGATASTPLAEPQSTTAEFGDWTTRCHRKDGQGLVCETAQFILLPNQRQPAAQLILSRPQGLWQIAIEVAPDVAVGDRLTVSMGQGGKPVMLDWTRCMPAACVAEAALTTATVDQWKAANKAGEFAYKDSRSKAIAFPMSAHGLREALAAFPKP